MFPVMKCLFSAVGESRENTPTIYHPHDYSRHNVGIRSLLLRCSPHRLAGKITNRLSSLSYCCHGSDCYVTCRSVSESACRWDLALWLFVWVALWRSLVLIDDSGPVQNSQPSVLSAGFLWRPWCLAPPLRRRYVLLVSGKSLLPFMTSILLCQFIITSAWVHTKLRLSALITNDLVKWHRVHFGTQRFYQPLLLGSSSSD